MSVAGGFSYFIRDHTLIDTAVSVTNGTDDQTVDVMNFGTKRRNRDSKDLAEIADIMLFFIY